MAQVANVQKPQVLVDLEKLIEKINSHPEVESAIDEVEGVRWLNMTNIVNGHVEVSASLVELLTQLSGMLDENFIDSRGQHSRLFYTARDYGYRMRTGESDSFGPLSSVMKPPFGDWQVCYG